LKITIASYPPYPELRSRIPLGFLPLEEMKKTKKKQKKNYCEMRNKEKKNEK
jgi:hypothetical protein